MKVEIAHLGFELITDLPFVQAQWDELYTLFETKDAKPQFSLNCRGERITKSLHSEPPQSHTQFNEDGEQVWNLYHNKDQFHFEFVDGNTLTNQTNRSQFEAHIVPHSESAKYLIPEILYLNALTQTEDGLLLHASGVVHNNRAHLFLGRSGAGKSTIAKKSFEAGKLVLNDDRIIIRKENGKYIAYGNPWHGTFPELSKQGCEVAGLYFIKKGLDVKLEKLDFLEAYSHLAQNLFRWPPFENSPPPHFKYAPLVQAIPCFKLQFDLESDLWQYLKS